MSITVQGVDARGYLGAWAEVVAGMTIADINAIPEDKWNSSMGGCARTNPALVADIVTNLRWTTETMEGKTSDAYNFMDDLAVKYVDKELAMAELAAAAKGFADTLKGASDEILNSTVMAPWQMPTPVMMLAQISASHIWYHDGQLNYVQCLLGDEKVHWLGGE